jgi:SH3-like domain-containing protein
MRMAALILLGLMMVPVPVMAQEGTAEPQATTQGRAIRTTGLPVPRFVSVKSDKAFIRTGPGLRYPISWVFEKEDLPVEIIQEFDTWRKIRGPEGEEGWVHQTLISGQRTVLVTGDAPVTLYRDPDIEARAVAKAEVGVIARLLRCGASMCELQKDNYRGWTPRNSLWGIYEGEQIK